jgi:23S rRNA-/tRNA-specific pseudouridylate synthase
MATPADQPRILSVHDFVVAVHKPAGMPVHPANASRELDLVTWLANEPMAPPGIAPVHRLDKDASGLVLCAAEPEQRAEISGWFARHELGKTYQALVYGHARKKGTIRRPLRDSRRRKPLSATTRYRLLEALGGFSLLRVQPETGRKHQIRRHLHGIGLPLVGDEEYKPLRFVPVPAFPGRLWLHAWRLVLPDGTELESPLPPELEENLKALRG